MTHPGSVLAWLLLAAVGCGSAPVETARGPLVISEVMTDNDSAWVDDAAEVEDWIELQNSSREPLQLSRYALHDGRGRSFQLPALALPAGALIVLFADDDASQGPLHMPWKLSAEGVALSLVEVESGRTLDHMEVPALAVNQAFARFGNVHEICRYASPERANGATCQAPEPPQLRDRSWPPYAFPEDWQRSAGPLVVTELALKTAQFVEVRNIGAEPLELSRYKLRLAAIQPGQPWPAADSGEALAWDRVFAPEAADAGAWDGVLGPGEALRVRVQATELARDPLFEGVLSLFDSADIPIERVDFMQWPEGASLQRADPAIKRFRFCKTPGAACDPLPSRPVGARLRHLYTPGDYAALAEGDSFSSQRGVKFVLDMQAGDSVQLLSSRSYALHYTFVREQIDRAPPLDRCITAQAEEFLQGWIAFSQREYFRAEGRRYLLGTLATYAGSDAHALDFAVGDQITGPQMQHAFFGALSHLDVETPGRWAIHPTEPRQESALESVQGQVPIMGANAPFRGLRWQPLTAGVALGRLRFIPEDELARAAVGPDTIVVTDAVPNDIPLVAGLITEAFQSPLAHVNVLSQSRGTPNLAVRDARKDPKIAPFLDQLVRFEVGADGFGLQPTTAEEVAAFLESRKPTGPVVQPRLDLSVRDLVDLQGKGLEDLPSIGAKAAQLAELARVHIGAGACAGVVPLPAAPFAIPIAFYTEHFERSGARALLDRGADTDTLAAMREAIEQTPLDPALLSAVTAKISERFGDARLRFRSSSNTEDLPEFNGAGLYESWPGALGDDERSIDRAIRSVWASLWTPRAYDERAFGHIDQRSVGMGVLVHPAFVSERANVIIISRDLLDPTQDATHSMNAQLGEASVANPAPGVTSEALLHHTAFVTGTPEIEYRSLSSLTHGARVLSLDDAQRLSCVVSAIHDHFRALLDPEGQDRWFAMDIEAKLVGAARSVVIKQARPYNFGRVERPSDCREY
jgi:hypothetical protein